MRQNFIQLDFMDKQDATGNKDIIVRLVNKDGTHTECVALWELLDLAKDIEYFKESYAIWHKTTNIHAVSRKKRLVSRLIRRVNKLTVQRDYWRKRAAELNGGAIRVEDDGAPVVNKKSSLPPKTVRCGKSVFVIKTNGRKQGFITKCWKNKINIAVTSGFGTDIPFRWDGTMYVSENADSDGDPIFYCEI